MQYSTLALLQLGSHLAQDRQIDETVGGNFSANTGFLPDLVDNRFQHGFFNIAIRIYHLLQDFERIGGDLWLETEISLQIRNNLCLIFDDTIHATKSTSNHRFYLLPVILKVRQARYQAALKIANVEGIS